MCTIAGWIGNIPYHLMESIVYNLDLRGADGVSYFAIDCCGNKYYNCYETAIDMYQDIEVLKNLKDPLIVMLFARAIPSNERYTNTKQRVNQPIYSERLQLLLTHNGTIANDRELAKKLQVEINTDSEIIPFVYESNSRDIDFVNDLEGSYAIALADLKDKMLILSRNFQPLSYIYDFHDKWFAYFSLPEMVDELDYCVNEIPSYSSLTVNLETRDIEYKQYHVWVPNTKKEVLVSYSGGLDSLVTARLYQVLDYDVHLLHFDYGQKASKVEKFLTEEFTKRYKMEIININIKDLFSQFKSRIINQDKEENSLKDAETTSSYVPARNLIFSSIAMGIAEQLQITEFALGLNIDDGGAYPDNTIDFVRKLEDISPFSLNWNHMINVKAPLVHLTKKQIVELGVQIGAPFELSCSCYYPELKDGQIKICNSCGPDLLRKEAFKAAGVNDPLSDTKDPMLIDLSENEEYLKRKDPDFRLNWYDLKYLKQILRFL